MPQFLKKFIFETNDNFLVYFVDGEYIRNYICVEFIGGGNGYAYPDFVPINEIWIENFNNSDSDKYFILHHELYEISLMKKGYTYDFAHVEANKHESILRNNFNNHLYYKTFKETINNMGINNNNLIKEEKEEILGLVSTKNLNDLLNDETLHSYFADPDNFDKFMEDLNEFFSESVLSVNQLRRFLNNKNYGDKTIDLAVDILSRTSEEKKQQETNSDENKDNKKVKKDKEIN